jgi:hypothetical protein
MTEHRAIDLGGEVSDMSKLRSPFRSCLDQDLGHDSAGGPLLSAVSGLETTNSRHDLRQTGATMLGEMGELPDIIEAGLNNVSIHSPLAATYNRSRYRRAATAGGCTGRDRGGSRRGGAVARASLTTQSSDHGCPSFVVHT